MNLPPMNRVSDKFRRTLLQVATHCRVEPSDILSTSRRREHVLPRQLFQWLLVKDHGMDPSAIATRYDKTARNFLGAIYLAAAVVWLN